MQLFSQRTITGTIFLDGEGEAIGANVVVEGNEKFGTVSEFDGTFSLEVPDDAEALIISYTGFEDKTVSIVGINYVEVILILSNVLSEVVVTAYGIERAEKTMGYTTTTVSGSNLRSIRKNRGRKNKNHYQEIPSHEEYAHTPSNQYISPKAEAVSTFSIDVDNASYSNIRRHIQKMETLPNKDAVRIEEMINYFNYDYPIPNGEHPFSITTELADCPWNKKHQLLRIGLQGYKMELEQAPLNNLVFLLDVSGSMADWNKLPLVKESLNMMINGMRDEDRISIVVYAGAAGLVLPPTSGLDKQKIKEALHNLRAGGSTAGGAGIALAYKQAKENFIPNGNNRVILCTDGDFNVGVNSVGGLEELIAEKRKDDIFLTVLGFGMGNYKDNRLETLADKGNGNYGYIDDIKEAKKMLVDEVASTMFTIAKDVKIQIQFNKDLIESYRLIGYENRLLNNEDFEDDTKDAGELGAGHTVTALYEIIPFGTNDKISPKVKRKDFKTPKTKLLNESDFATIRLRYKKPKGKKSQLIEQSIGKEKIEQEKMSDDFKFLCAVSSWGMMLKDSEFKGNSSIKLVSQLAKEGMGNDKNAYRKEFLELVRLSKEIDKGGTLNAKR